MLVKCYDHIQAACSNLVATNASMKKKLETVRSALPNPMDIYTRMVKRKFSEGEAKKQALADTFADSYVLMNKVHD